MTQISDHFSKEELEETETRLPNECPEKYAGNAVMLAEDVLEPSRILVGPLHVNSWYRSPEVNRTVGGDRASAHLEARAADVVPNGNIFNAFKMIVASDIPYDKIIYEKRHSLWLHIQIRKSGEPRRLAFTSHVGPDGTMVYEPYKG